MLLQGEVHVEALDAENTKLGRNNRAGESHDRHRENQRVVGKHRDLMLKMTVPMEMVGAVAKKHRIERQRLCTPGSSSRTGEQGG